MARPLRQMLIVVLVIAAALLGVAGVLLYQVAHFDLAGHKEDLSPAYVEEYGCLKLPPGYANLMSHRSGFTDTKLNARFTIPADQFGVFLASTLCTGDTAKESPVMVPPLNGRGIGWWRPGAPAKSVRASGSDGGRFQELLIDQTDPQTYTVWVEAMTN